MEARARARTRDTAKGSPNESTKVRVVEKESSKVVTRKAKREMPVEDSRAKGKEMESNAIDVDRQRILLVTAGNK